MSSMPDNARFNPDKISFVDTRFLRWQLDTPDAFDIFSINGYDLDNTFQLAFSVEEKLAKADLTITIKTESNIHNPAEAEGYFHLAFFYRVENLDALVTPDKHGHLIIDPHLSIALSSISYSTCRGILMSRLAGTALQNFVLPIINPDKLLVKHSSPKPAPPQ
jgi:hypothetical protein